MSIQENLLTHLQAGHTTVARCWGICRTDGVLFGFTDHDCDLGFEGFQFRADTGLSAASLEQSTGLSVDNTEALGALSDASVSETDIEAGRFDGAEVFCWLVNWSDLSQRSLQFRGSIGELRRAGGAFHAELRGLTEALNRPLGRVFQKPCTAVLGDKSCGFDRDQAGYFALLEVDSVEEDRILIWHTIDGFEPGWFQRGRLSLLSGEAKGLFGAIKKDHIKDGKRVVELWEPMRAPIRTGDQIRLDAGCDKRMETCRLKFNNIVNFQGFPDIPGEDWMTATPKRNDANSGGSLR